MLKRSLWLLALTLPAVAVLSRVPAGAAAAWVQRDRFFGKVKSHFGFRIHSTNSTATGAGMTPALCPSSSSRRTASRPRGP